MTEWQINSRNSPSLTIRIPSFILSLDCGKASVWDRWNLGQYVEKVACGIIQIIATLLDYPFAIYHAERLGYLFGRSFHLARVYKIHRMHSRVSRLSTGGRLRRRLGFGNKSSTFFHNSSFINRVCFAVGSPPIACHPKALQMASFGTS